jgi:hypothetical protein
MTNRPILQSGDEQYARKTVDSWDDEPLDREEPTDVVMEKESQFERETKQQILKRHTISMEFLDQGCIIRVGCKSLAFQSNQDAMIALNNYITGDTVEIYEMYLNNFK